MISVIIPTHRPTFLEETIQSVLAQTHQDFEIVVVPNSSCPAVSLPEDPRIRKVPYYGAQGIGAVKRFGFMEARGEILLELDHDDLLMPTALAEVQKAFENIEIGFVYSDFAEWKADGTWTTPWSELYGWHPKREQLLGKNALVYKSWEPVPASLGLLSGAPNHLRAWRRSAYREAGGHDPRFQIADDHDLLIRTYYVTKMLRIPSCLYLYRISGDNTHLARAPEIEGKSHELYAKNIEMLVSHWARSQGLPLIELNRAYTPMAGWGHAPDADYSGKWPFGDHSVGAFRAYDFLHNYPDRTHVVSEIHRCLAPGGWLFSFTPAFPSKGSVMAPNTKSYWNQNCLWYYVDRHWAQYIGTPVRLQSQRTVEAYPSMWHKQNDVKYLTWDAVALKDGYDGPGERKI